MAGRILRSERLIKSSKINRQMSPTSLVAESTLQLLAQRVTIQGDDHLLGWPHGLRLCAHEGDLFLADQA